MMTSDYFGVSVVFVVVLWQYDFVLNKNSASCKNLFRKTRLKGKGYFH